jgi:hypothetical protein
MADKAEPSWTVTDQHEDYRPTPAGPFALGVVITFRTAAGVTGTVFIPNEQYTLEAARKAIDERAQAMAAVSDLSG